ncbi:MAG TPA: peroxiredoxin [Rhodanobacteraceae bacterium]
MTTTIQIGDRMPEATLNVLNDKVESVSAQAFFAAPKVVMFAVPGAFTPTCSNRHLPGYAERFAEFEQRGIKVACLSVNDAFVMRAWAQAQNVPPALTMLADGNGTFAKALGLDMDGSGFGMGLRAKRFALYAEDGVVKILHVEAPGEFRVSSAEAMLEAIDAIHQPGRD